MIDILKCSLISALITLSAALVMWYFTRYDFDFKDIYNEGLELYKKKNYKAALNKFQQALKKFPNQYYAIYNAGLCELKLKSYKKAKEYFQNALKYKPDDYETLYNLAYSEVLLAEYEDAKIIFQKLEEQNLNDSDVFFNIGYIANAEDDTNKAKEYIAKAIEISPEKKHYKKFYLEVLQTYFDKSADLSILDGMLNLCQELLVIYPDDETIIYRTAVIYEQLGDWENSVNYCERLYSKNQNSHKACNQYALALFCKGEMQEAITMYEKAIEIEPNIPDSYMNLVFTYDKNNEISSAIELAQTFIKKFPEDASVEIAKDYLRKLNIKVDAKNTDKQEQNIEEQDNN